MKIPVDRAKTIIYPVRFTEETWEKVQQVAKENKISAGKVVRYFVEEALSKV